MASEPSASRQVALPFHIGRTRLLLVGVHFDPDAISAVLPDGLEAVDGAPGIINSFVAENSYPFGAYSGFYLSVDVVGHDGPDGSTGRHMFAAAHGPQEGPAALMREHVGFPSRRGGVAFANSRTGGTRVTAGVDEDVFFRADVSVGKDVSRGNGSFIYPLADPRTGLIVQRPVPWVGDWADGVLLSAMLEAPTDDPFGRVPVLSYDWAGELSDCSFSFSMPPNTA